MIYLQISLIFLNKKTTPTVKQVENLVYYELIKNDFEDVEDYKS